MELQFEHTLSQLHMLFQLFAYIVCKHTISDGPHLDTNSVLVYTCEVVFNRLQSKAHVFIFEIFTKYSQRLMVRCRILRNVFFVSGNQSTSRGLKFSSGNFCHIHTHKTNKKKLKPRAIVHFSDMLSNHHHTQARTHARTNITSVQPN